MVTVWVEAWQQECCGDDIRVGEDVQWEVARISADCRVGVEEMTNAAAAQQVEFIEDHHLDDVADLKLEGRVRSIQIFHGGSETRQSTTARTAAEAWPEPDGLSLLGFVVDVDARPEPLDQPPA